MSDVTRMLSQIEEGDPSAAEELLPLVYEELRKLAAARLAQEKPGQTLQATALVHEAYMRLVKLRFFAGCSLEETADYLGVSRATAQRHWAYARAWLFGQLNPE